MTHPAFLVCTLCGATFCGKPEPTLECETVIYCDYHNGSHGCFPGECRYAPSPQEASV
jgi:hypothetical protein